MTVESGTTSPQLSIHITAPWLRAIEHTNKQHKSVVLSRPKQIHSFHKSDKTDDLSSAQRAERRANFQ
jgi:hypothetical protein